MINKEKEIINEQIDQIITIMEEWDKMGLINAIEIVKEEFYNLKKFSPLNLEQIKLLDDYMMFEFGHRFNYSYENEIQIGYTEINNGDPVDIILNVKEKKIEWKKGKQTIYQEEFKDLTDTLKILDYEVLVSTIIYEYED